MVILLAYCIMNWGPIDWMLQTSLGRDALYWLMSQFDWEGCESALDALVIMSCGAVMPLAVWLCMLLTRYLRQKVRTAPSAEP